VDFEIVSHHVRSLSDPKARKSVFRVFLNAPKWDAPVFLLEALADVDDGVRSLAVRLLDGWIGRSSAISSVDPPDDRNRSGHLPHSLDTSGLLDGWVRDYSPEVFPSLWKQMESAAAEGTIVAVQDVLLELEPQDDDVFAWAKRHVTFVPLEEEIQASAIDVLARFP
jgi:Domain of unknown function (DUF4411)